MSWHNPCLQPKSSLNRTARARWKMVICKVNMMSVDGGGGGGVAMEGGYLRKWDWKEQNRQRKTLSQCNKTRDMKCQACFSRLYPRAMSFLRIHTVALHGYTSPITLINASLTVNVLHTSGPQFSNCSNTLNIGSNNPYTWCLLVKGYVRSLITPSLYLFLMKTSTHTFMDQAFNLWTVWGHRQMNVCILPIHLSHDGSTAVIAHYVIR